ncbi:hypothetical protein EDD85DRAFT_11574 [Armillaria nabsnona]|nr:hypothetical protein EDD85DRAFT_11574 [Armillaria nabsnona]
MSTQRSTVIDARTPLKTGYYVARESNIVRSMPVLCGEFLTTRLEPAEWFRLRAIDSRCDSMIAEFGHAIGRNLKSVADQAWSDGDPPKGHVDFLAGYPSTFRYLETLIHVKAMDIASGFLRVKNRSFYPNFERQLRFESRDRDMPNTKPIFQYLSRLDNWCSAK